VGRDDVSTSESIGSDLAPRRTGHALVFERPAELVDVSERIYRQVFAIGLWVAAGFGAVGALAALLQPAGSRLVGVLVSLVYMAATAAVAARAPSAYRGLRRRPWLLMSAGVALGLGALLTGSHNDELFLPMIAIIGVAGVAASRSVVTASALVAAVGLGAPQLMHGHDNLGGALVVIVPPLMYWLIVDRIAGFALRLHQHLRKPVVVGAWTSRSQSPVQTASAEPAQDESGNREPQRALPAPQVIRINGIRLTSRQLQVIMLACEGLRHDEIGACLDDITPQTVLRHLRKAEARTGSASTPQLVAWAREVGLAPHPSGDS
jgi:DNA-binding CsgD family transcriptional regulator